MRTLRKLRKISGVPQFEVSRLTGISPVKLSLAENEHIQLSKAEDAAIEKAIARATEERAAKVRSFLGTATDDETLIPASA